MKILSNVVLAGVLAGCFGAFAGGERVVFFGDSITEGGQYLTYMQLFSALRDPGNGIEAYNFGKSGDTAKGGLARWDWDGANRRPDRIFVMFGMNDSQYMTLSTAEPADAADATRRKGIADAYRRDMEKLLDRLGRDCRNVTLITPTPYDQYGPQKVAPMLGSNEPMLTEFAQTVRDLAKRRGLPTVELHRPMTDLLKAHPEARLVGGDRVHPSDAGQYLMACLCLAETGASGIVDETSRDAAGRRTLSFDYKPKALPLPVTDVYRAVEKVWPVTERLNREMLSVANLPQGTYALLAGERELGRFSAEQFAKGVNLALLDTPNRREAERADALRARINKIESDFRSVGFLLQWMKQANVSLDDPAAVKAYFAKQRERAKTISWGGWLQHCVGTLERLIPQWKALEAEEASLRASLRAVRPVASRFSVREVVPYAWRGLMLDEGRFFFGKAAVKETLDRMAACGLNVFHWHLTEDQGWRLEIRRFPELTRIGAVRPCSAKVHTENVSDGKPYGPFFYTTEDVREIVAYAAARKIRVVPEIELPGHIKALLAAHPEFSCTGKVTPADMMPMGVQPDVLCAGNDEAIRFLEQVFDEVCELFPDEVVHIGGDECPKGRWQKCPKCQARIRRLGLRNENDLQAWVTHHFANYLAKKGKRAMGWDEILEGEGCPTNVIVQSWRTTASPYFKLKESPAVTAARRGFDVVLSPIEQTYFSVPYGKDDPGLYRRPVGSYSLYISEDTVRKFRADEGFPPELKGRILGAECCCWSEGTRSPESLHHKTWPRAEVFSKTLNHVMNTKE